MPGIARPASAGPCGRRPASAGRYNTISKPADRAQASEFPESARDNTVRAPAGCKLSRAATDDLLADSEFRNDGRVCICKMCTCGRHHCVKCGGAGGLDHGGAPFKGSTESRINYVAHPHVAVRRGRPASAARVESAPFDAKTHYQREYTRKKVPTARAKRVEPATGDWLHYGPRGVDLTTYGRHFQTPVAGEPTPRCKHNYLKAQWIDTGGRLDGQSAYQAAYVHNDVPRSTQTSFKNDTHERRWGDLDPNVGFDASTTYGRDYVVPPMERAMRVTGDLNAHDPVMYRTPGTQDWGTTHRTAFQGKPLPPCCPVELLPRPPGAKNGRHHTFWDQDGERWV